MSAKLKNVQLKPAVHRKLGQVCKLRRFGTFVNTIECLIEEELTRLKSKVALTPHETAEHEPRHAASHEPLPRTTPVGV